MVPSFTNKMPIVFIYNNAAWEMWIAGTKRC